MEQLFMSFDAWYINNKTTLITVALVLLGTWLIRLFGGLIIRNAVRRAVIGTAYRNKIEEQKREETIIQIITGALSILLWPMAIIIIISQLGVNIAPLIAGAGIFGLAIGFGAQSLVKDVINGLFIIAENQYRVGDVVGLNEIAVGVVEKISLRTTVLRDLDGIVHIVPNGTIEWTSNYSKEHSGINLDIGVSYSTDLEKVIKVINKVGDDLASDSTWKDKIIEKPQFLRVDDFADSSVVLKITGLVEPLMQWEVTGELRKRIKLAFDKEKIEIPFPQRVIHTEK